MKFTLSEALCMINDRTIFSSSTTSFIKTATHTEDRYIYNSSDSFENVKKKKKIKIPYNTEPND